MNVLLLSMPDYFEHMPPVAVRMPKWRADLASPENVDGHHRVAVADLILLSYRRVREDPEVVGLSVMTFQRQTRATEKDFQNDLTMP